MHQWMNQRLTSCVSSPHSPPSNLRKGVYKTAALARRRVVLQVLLDVVEDIEPNTALDRMSAPEG